MDQTFIASSDKVVESPATSHMNLSELNIGDECIIIRINESNPCGHVRHCSSNPNTLFVQHHKPRRRFHGSAGHRLMEMGLTPGTHVEVLNLQEHGPILLGVRDCKLALGRGMASMVIVKQLHSNQGIGV